MASPAQLPPADRAPGPAPLALATCRQVGWEERAEAAMTHLLRSALSRDAREAAVAVPPLCPAKDTQRLRRHLSLVVERLSKGMRLAGGGGGGAVAAAAPEAPADGAAGGRRRQPGPASLSGAAGGPAA
jgi:hypothetical protein